MSYFWTVKQTFIGRTNRFCSRFSTEITFQTLLPFSWIWKLKSAAPVGLFVSGFPSSRPGYCLCSCHDDGATFQWWEEGGGGYNLIESLLSERCLVNHTQPRQQQQINFWYFHLRIVTCCHKNTLLLAAELCVWVGAFSRPKHTHAGSNKDCRSTAVRLDLAKLWSGNSCISTVNRTRQNEDSVEMRQQGWWSGITWSQVSRFTPTAAQKRSKGGRKVLWGIKAKSSSPAWITDSTSTQVFLKLVGGFELKQWPSCVSAARQSWESRLHREELQEETSVWCVQAEHRQPGGFLQGWVCSSVRSR